MKYLFYIVLLTFCTSGFSQIVTFHVKWPPPSTSTVTNNAVPMAVLATPRFPGGSAALLSYVGANVQYPKRCREEGLQGTVYVSLFIDEKGKVTNARVIRGVKDAKEMDDEALRVVLGMPNWIAPTEKGQPISSTINLPIKFQLK